MQNWIITILIQIMIFALLSMIFPELGSYLIAISILFFIIDCFVLFFQSRKISQKTKTIIRVITALIVFIPFAMIAGMPNSIEFYLIFIPLSLIFSIKTILLLNINNKNHTINNDNHFITGLQKKRVAINIIYYLLIPVFMFFSFGSKYKVCVDGDCENGFGRALYRINAIGGYMQEIERYTGYTFTRNISWYNGGAPIKMIYIGEFKNGKMKGNGQIFYSAKINDKRIIWMQGKFDGFDCYKVKYRNYIDNKIKLKELLEDFNIDKNGRLK